MSRTSAVVLVLLAVCAARVDAQHTLAVSATIAAPLSVEAVEWTVRGSGGGVELQRTAPSGRHGTLVIERAYLSERAATLSGPIFVAASAGFRLEEPSVTSQAAAPAALQPVVPPASSGVLLRSAELTRGVNVLLLTRVVATTS